MSFPSTLSLGIAGVMDADKFETITQKLGTRFIYQECSPCPNDMKGCERCRAKGGVVGKHPRPIERVVREGIARRRQDGEPIYLEHRMLTGSPSITTAEGTSLVEGEHFRMDGRKLIFLDDRLVRPGDAFQVRYEAYAEDFANFQHAYADFAGTGRKAEYSMNLKFANLEQGIIAMSIPASARGYHCGTGDRYIIPDATIRFSMSVDADRGNLRSRHQFVTNVVRAYGITKHDAEVPLQAAWNREKLKFELTGPDFERAVIIYDAAPVYTVYLDMGEFRHPQAENHHRLALLIREEIAR